CAGNASATRLLPRRSGWSYWTVYTWCDRRLSARSRTLHHIHDRSTDASITWHGIAKTPSSKSRRLLLGAGFFCGHVASRFRKDVLTCGRIPSRKKQKEKHMRTLSVLICSIALV